MKAITTHQPWASLIACGAKRYETRSWPTKHRGPIAIHAGKRLFDELNREMVDVMRTALFPERSIYDDFFLRCEIELPFGAVIATAEIVNCWYIAHNPGTDIDVAKNIPIGAESMTTDKHASDFHDYFVPTKQEILFGDWTPGRYAWELANVKRLPEPILCRGRQGLWDWEVRND